MKSTDSTRFLSRQYMLEDSFEIYYYEDFPASGVAPHSHSFYEFYFLLEGQVLMTIQDRPYTVTPGNIIMIPPGAVHFPALKEPGLPYRRFVLWIHKDYYRKRLASGEVFRYLFDGCNTLDAPVLTISQPLFNDLQSRIFSLIREGHDNLFGKESACGLLLASLLLEIGRAAYRREHRGSQPPSSLRGRICTYIDEHLQEPLSLELLSQVFYLNRYYLAHSFKEAMGISIHQYILKKRLEACKNAMVTEASLEEIAAGMGFLSYSSFFRYFKKEYGISPREYRKYLNLCNEPPKPAG